MSQVVVGPSPFDAEHSALRSRLTALRSDISRLTAEAASVEQQLEQTLGKKSSWETQERSRLQKVEEERLERERQEKRRIEQERLEAERLEAERVERLRLEQLEQERIARERAETEARLEAEKQAKQAEKERLEREWMEREKQEQLAREEHDRKRRETEAALAAAAAGAIAAQSASSAMVDGAGVDGASGAAPKELHARARALYDLDGDEANDELSFATGDEFTVSGEMNGWMSARHERTGKVGLVPSNYIQLIEQLDTASATTAAASTTTVADAKAAEEVKEQEVATVAPVTVSTVSSGASSGAGLALKGKGKGERVVALFDFAGENDDEISFSAGQRLWKTGEVNGWYIGTLDGTERVGIFPSNFVEPVPAAELKAEEADAAAASSGSKATFAAADGRDDSAQRSMPLTSAPSVQRTKSTAFAAAEVATLAQMAADSQAPDTPRLSTSGRRPSLPASANAPLAGGVEPDAIALYRFQATSADQLSFDKGAKLLIKATLNGWYVGQEIGRDALGIFPANYVQKLDKPEAVTPVAASVAAVQAEELTGGRASGVVVGDETGNEQSYHYKQRQDGATSAAANSTSTQQQTSAAGEASVVIGRVTALYDFHSTTADSLSFSKGDEIDVVKEIKGWWAGSVVGRDGKLGLVPSNYCTPLQPEPAAAQGAGVVGAQYPVVGAANGGAVSSMQVVQIITPSQQAPQAAQSSVVVNTAAASTTSAAYSGVNTPSASSPVSTVGRQSGGAAPPLLSAKPALLSSLATQANNGSSGVGVGSRPSLQPAQNVQSVQSGQSAQPIVQPIAVIEPTATSASTSTLPSTNNDVATTTTVQPATANTPAITTTHTPAVVVAAPSTTTTTTTNTAASSTPAVTAAAAAAASSFVRQPTDQLAIAEHDWDTTERGELPFKKNDRIVVTREKNGWSTGYVEGTQRKGMFPSTFVRLVQDNAAVKAAAPMAVLVPASIAPTVTNTPVTSRPPSPSHGHARNVSTSWSQQPGMNGQPQFQQQPVQQQPGVIASSADPNNASLQALGGGMQVTKLDSHGYPKLVRMYVAREKLSRGKVGEWVVRWDTKKFNKREAQLTLSKCRVKRGLKAQEAGGQGVQHAFTVLSPVRNLQVLCGSEKEREMWMEAFAVLGVPLDDTTGVAAAPYGAAPNGFAAAQGVNGAQQVQQGAVVSTREQSVKRAGTPAPVVVEEEEVSMHDILAQGPPTPIVAHSNSAVAMTSVVQALQQRLPQQPQPVPGGARVVQALYDFGSEADDLQMVAGDRIELVDANVDEQWWRGRNLTKGGGRLGMFPHSYVSEAVVEQFAVLKPVSSMNNISQQSIATTAGTNSRPSSRASNAAPTSTTVAPVGSFTPVATLVPPSSAVPAAGVAAGHAKVRALYDFETDLVKHPNDLPFKQGEVLTLLSKDNEWWTGVDGRGRKGMFPAAFVKEMV